MNKEIGRFSVIDVGVEDHGCLYLDAEVMYASGGRQGIGRVFDPQVFGALVFALVDLCRPTHATRSGMLRNVRNLHVWVTRDGNGIVRIEPIFEGEGRAIDFREGEADYFAKRT